MKVIMNLNVDYDWCWQNLLVRAWVDLFCSDQWHKRFTQFLRVCAYLCFAKPGLNCFRWTTQMAESSRERMWIPLGKKTSPTTILTSQHLLVSLLTLFTVGSRNRNRKKRLYAGFSFVIGDLNILQNFCRFNYAINQMVTVIKLHTMLCILYIKYTQQTILNIQ